MKTKLLVTFFLISGLLLTGCGPKKTALETTSNPPSNQQAATNQDEQSGQGSIWDLFSQGKSLKCTFQKTGDEVSQTVYLSGKKLRMDFSSKQGDQVVDSHMILADDFAYLWSGNSKDGMKWPMENQMTGSEAADWRQGLDQSLNYNCSAWLPDNSKFSPPTEITFQDFSQTLNQYKQQMCDSCNKMPAGESRDQCLSSSGCQ